MGFPVLKRRGTFSILDKSNHYKKSFIWGGLIFSIFWTQILQKMGIFFIQVRMGSNDCRTKRWQKKWENETKRGKDCYSNNRNPTDSRTEFGTLIKMRVSSKLHKTIYIILLRKSAVLGFQNSFQIKCKKNE